MSGERTRLFVALELPDDVRHALARWRDHAIAGADGVRPVGRGDLHVTLCFLGWRLEEEIESIAGGCRVLEGGGPLRLALGEPVVLPPRRPRVLAVSIEDPDRRLVSAQATLSRALAAGGWYEPEERPFYGHVTVARAGRRARIPRSAMAGEAPPAIRFEAGSVTLYRSRLSRSGASYQPLARIVLGSA